MAESFARCATTALFCASALLSCKPQRQVNVAIDPDSIGSPVVILRPFPTYPWPAVSYGVKATVRVRHCLEPDGSTKDVEVLEVDAPVSSRASFASETILAVRLWKYAMPSSASGSDSVCMEPITFRYGYAYKRAIEIVDPNPNSRSPPVWPKQAFIDGVTGSVIVGYCVDPEGRTVKLQVVESEPPGYFEESALRALSGWVHKVKRVDGVPTEYCPLPIRFDFTF